MTQFLDNPEGFALPASTTDALNLEVLRAELKRDEGNKLKAYKDTLGLWSIGVGRNLDRRNSDGTQGITSKETQVLKITRDSCLLKGITQAQCDRLLDNDIKAVMAELDHALPWWRSLDPVRQRVMLNLGFMGVGNASHGLLSFHNTLEAIRTHRWEDAAHGLETSQYARQVGARATRLANLLRLGVAK